MGPLWRGVVLVPPHAKGALGITAVPNRGRSLLPEARQGLISLKAMRRDSPPQELGAKFSWESEWLVPRQGDNSRQGSLTGTGEPGWDSTSALRSHPGVPVPPGTMCPPGDQAAPRRTECLEALCDPVT